MKSKWIGPKGLKLEYSLVEHLKYKSMHEKEEKKKRTKHTDRIVLELWNTLTDPLLKKPI